LFSSFSSASWLRLLRITFGDPVWGDLSTNPFPLRGIGLFCFHPSAQQAGFGYCGLPSVIRFGVTFQPIPFRFAESVFFVFILQLSKLASVENKKSLALRAEGLVEVGGGFEPP
jgi:hypothetical protein